MGGGNVRCRHGHSLAADQLEKAVSSGVQRYAALADGDSSLCCHRHHIPVRLSRNATLHIFPILMKSTEYRVQTDSVRTLSAERSVLCQPQAVCELSHTLSHQRLHARFIIYKVEELPQIEGTIAVRWEELDDYAFSRLTLRAIDTLRTSLPH